MVQHQEHDAICNAKTMRASTKQMPNAFYNAESVAVQCMGQTTVAVITALFVIAKSVLVARAERLEKALCLSSQLHMDCTTSSGATRFLSHALRSANTLSVLLLHVSLSWLVLSVCCCVSINSLLHDHAARCKQLKAQVLKLLLHGRF